MNVSSSFNSNNLQQAALIYRSINKQVLVYPAFWAMQKSPETTKVRYRSVYIQCVSMNFGNVIILLIFPVEIKILIARLGFRGWLWVTGKSPRVIAMFSRSWWSTGQVDSHTHPRLPSCVHMACVPHMLWTLPGLVFFILKTLCALGECW